MSEQLPSIPPYKIRVLIVEDHRALAENLFEFLGEEHYTLDFAYDGLTALHLVSCHSYDVIVLDIMLPGLSGLQICQKIREDLGCHTPILFMTARDGIDDKTLGFTSGGDDYLVKPFDMREMALRIQALARRSTHTDNNLKAGSVSFDAGTLSVLLNNGKSIELSATNARLFETLIKHYPHYVSYEKLNDTIWGIEEIELNTLRTHIYNLRKMVKQSLGHSLIKTVHGRGYRLIPPEEE